MKYDCDSVMVDVRKVHEDFAEDETNEHVYNIAYKSSLSFHLFIWKYPYYIYQVRFTDLFIHTFRLFIWKYPYYIYQVRFTDLFIHIPTTFDTTLKWSDYVEFSFAIARLRKAALRQLADIPERKYQPVPPDHSLARQRRNNDSNLHR
jgi:hypothetical protein